MITRRTSDDAGTTQLKFGDRMSWPAGLAAAMTCVILLGAAAVATAVSSFMDGLPSLGGGAASGEAAGRMFHGLLWLLAFQAAVIGLTLAAARLYGGEPKHVLALVWRDNALPAVAGAVARLGVFAAAYIAIVYAVDRAAVLHDLAPAASLARSDIWLLALVAIGIGAPLSEELLFRGFLFPALAKSTLGVAGAAVVSTLAWTALHAGYSVYGLVEVFLVGLFFCWLMVRSGSLWVPILCHAIYNTAIVLGLRWLPIPL